jgi:2-keto-myo-inositol isomerase
MDFMNLCLSQLTTLPTPFAEDLSAYAGVGWTAVEIWLTKLEKQIESAGPDATRQLFADHHLRIAAAAYQGGLLLSQGEQRKVHFELYRNRLELCQTFQIPTLLLVADFLERPDATNLGRAVVSLKQAAQWAAAFDVRLALEFRGSDTFCTSLDTALGLIDQCDEPNVGLCLDLFHFYKGPSKAEDFERLSNANLFHVQLCDIPGVPREMMTDADRVLPGDGDFRFGPVVDALRAIDYSGFVSLEVMNPVLWQMKPTQVAELALMSLKRATEANAECGMRNAE